MKSIASEGTQVGDLVVDKRAVTFEFCLVLRASNGEDWNSPCCTVPPKEEEGVSVLLFDLQWYRELGALPGRYIYKYIATAENLWRGQ